MRSHYEADHRLWRRVKISFSDQIKRTDYIITREYSVKLFLNSALNLYEYIIFIRSLFGFLTSTDYRESESERERYTEREIDVLYLPIGKIYKLNKNKIKYSR